MGTGKMPTVSVIIPTFNYGHFITEAVESVLAQTYRDIEMVVVDDGSTDGTRKVLKNYIERGDLAYVYQKNSGPGAARNTGIRASKGAYICFLDADDIYLPSKVATQAVLLEQDRELSGCFCDGRTFEGRPMLRGFRGRGKDCYFEDVLSGLNLFTPSLMVRRSVIDETGFVDESFRQSCEDLDFALRLLKGRTFAYIPEQLYVRRVHKNNLSGRHGRVSYFLKLYEKHAPLLTEAQGAKLRKTLGSHIFSEVRQDMACRMFIKGMSDFLQAVRMDSSKIVKFPSVIVRYLRFTLKGLKRGPECPAR